MEQALIEAAAPVSLRFDAGKSRLILDPLIAQDPSLRLRASEGNPVAQDEMLWNAVAETAKRQGTLERHGRLELESAGGGRRLAANRQARSFDTGATPSIKAAMTLFVAASRPSAALPPQPQRSEETPLQELLL